MTVKPATVKLPAAQGEAIPSLTALADSAPHASRHSRRRRSVDGCASPFVRSYTASPRSSRCACLAQPASLACDGKFGPHGPCASSSTRPSFHGPTAASSPSQYPLPCPASLTFAIPLPSPSNRRRALSSGACVPCAAARGPSDQPYEPTAPAHSCLQRRKALAVQLVLTPRRGGTLPTAATPLAAGVSIEAQQARAASSRPWASYTPRRRRVNSTTRSG